MNVSCELWSNTNLGYWDWDIHTETLSFNERFAELTGLENPTLKTGIEQFLDRLHPIDKTIFRASIFSKSNLEKNHYSGYFRIARETGYWSWIQLGCRVVDRENGKPVRVIGILKDIDAIKKVTDDLSIVLQSQQLIVDNVEEGIFGINLLGIVAFVNPAAERMLGWTTTDLVDAILHDKMYHSDVDGTPYSYQDCPVCMAYLRGQVQHQVSALFWRKDGSSFPAEYTSIPIRNDENELIGSVIVFQDVSQRIEHEQERQRLEIQLRQAQKMETIGQLTGGIAHDFNNILGSMLGFTHLAKQHAKNSTNLELQDYLNEVETAGERAKGLISKLTVFSHAAKRKPEYTQVMTVIDESVRLIRPTIPASITINTVYDPEIEHAILFIDPLHIQQVIMNLCINARDAMAGEGEISIELTIRKIDSLRCSSCLRKLNGEYLELIVKDNGCGIQKERTQAIFDPFFTTKQTGQGTGLGLTVVDGLVHESKGHIFLVSEPDKGSEFRIVFPEFNDEDISNSQSIEKPKLDVPVVSREARILVVDDEEAIGRFLKEFLSDLGYHVSCFQDGQSALNVFNQDKISFDLVVTDQTMPNMTGIELSREILALNPEIPIILCSGYTDQVNQNDITDYGIRRYLNKPVELGELTSTISSLLSEQESE